MPKLGRWKGDLDRLLASTAAKPARERLTLLRVFEALRALGYEGGYDAVRHYANNQRRDTRTSVDAYIPRTSRFAATSWSIRLPARRLRALGGLLAAVASRIGSSV